ncbi:serine hydrolase domain-containing protein [Sphingomonas antarctica]|uniref:serine hydrolase domain-containing protein n=1 Tax=Sphingomonas antarctica TaxID=2040274 RepID=UPI0039EB43E3
MASAKSMTPARAADIDAAVHVGMTRTGAQGLALAVVEDGKVVLTRAYGLRTAQGSALKTDSVVYAASLCKTVFAYTVMRLVAEGKVDLDQSFAAMLPKPLPDYGNLPHGMGNWGDLAGDERWRKLTPRITLTHATGFANFAFLEPDQKLKFHFEPGTRYAYSGEGLLLLQFAIEQKLGHSVGIEADRLTFGPLGMTSSAMDWQPAWADRAAQAWDAKGEAFQHTPRKRVRIAGSMDTTIEDMGRFAAALVSGTGLNRATFDDMTRPQRPITSVSQFPTLQDDAPPEKRFRGLSAGLGVVTFSGPQGAGFYKGGHDDMTGNTMVCVKRGRRCVVLLGNDVRAEPLFPELVNHILGETGAPWRWEYPEQFVTP